MQRHFQVIDVFSEEPFRGNPLAVVHDASGISDEEMLQLTRWLNLSETTFLLPPTDAAADYRVRIFSPPGELPFAGHPTLGTCHAWLSAGGMAKTPGRVVQECGVGLVTVRQDAGGYARVAAPHPPAPSPQGEKGGRSRKRQTWRAPHEGRGKPENPLPTGGEGRVRGGRLPPSRPRRWCAPAPPMARHANASLASPASAPTKSSARQGTALGRAGRVHLVRDSAGAVWVGGSATILVDGTIDV